MSAIEEFLNIPVRYLHDDKDKVLSLSALQLELGSPALVVDLWHTKCTKCPAALAKLNDIAESADRSDVVYVSVALSLGEGNYDLAADVSEGQWENLVNLFMEVEDKERAKQILGFTAVPYYVVVAKNGTIVGKGDPKSVNVEELLSQAAKLGENASNTEQQTGQLVLDEDF